MDANIVKFQSQKRIHVLVIDVDPVSRKSLERMLLFCNYKVTAVGNFHEAFRLLMEEKNEFHIAMLDVHQPFGPSFVEIKCVSLTNASVYVIDISSIDDNMLQKEALVDGANMVMLKPVGLETIRFLWQHLLPRNIHTGDHIKEGEATSTNIDKFDHYRIQIHILVVDADPISRRLLEKTLLSCNYQVTLAEDVQKASSLLARGKTKFTIAMIDVHQSEADGFDFMELATNKDIYTIHISAANDDVLVRNGQSRGANLFMMKPVRSDIAKYLWQHVLLKLPSQN